MELVPAFLLHARPYRETSFLLEFFIENHGHQTLLARGVRRTKGLRGLLQPFVPLRISWRGRGDLPFLTQTDSAGALYEHSGNALLLGLYVNEITYQLLRRHEAHDWLFLAYGEVLQGLSGADSEAAIRRYEKQLLMAFGYDLPIRVQGAVETKAWYRFLPEQGFEVMDAGQVLRETMLSDCFKGESLLAFAQEDWSLPRHLADAKRLLRMALAPYLGRPLVSADWV